MIVEELIASLGIEVDHASLARAAQAFDNFGKQGLSFATKAFGAVGLALAGVTAAVYKTAESGDQLSGTAEKLGLTTDALQELSYTALLTDTSAESLATGLNFLAKNASEAAVKGGEAAAAFAGIRLRNSDGSVRGVDELLGDVADKFTRLPDAASKIRLAMALFGRSGTELIPMLNRGSAGIAQLREEAQRMGFVLDTQSIAAAERFDDTLKRLNAALTGWRNRLAAPLIEKFTRLLEILTTKVGKSGGVFALVARAVGALIDGLNWFLTNDAALRTVFAAIGTAFITWQLSALMAATATTGLGTAAVAAAFAAAKAWATTTLPLILIGGLLYLLIDDFYAFATGGKSALGELIKALNHEDWNDTVAEKTFKRLGALVFDFTDPSKWRKLGDILSQFFADLSAHLRASGGFWKVLAFAIDEGQLSQKARVFGETNAVNQERINDNGIGAFFDSSIGAPAEVPIPGANTVLRDRFAIPSTFAPVINITTPPGADAPGLANMVRETVQEQWDRNMREAATQTGGYAR